MRWSQKFLPLEKMRKQFFEIFKILKDPFLSEHFQNVSA